ncbi:hypothetical protein KUV85_00035 [Nocardioides panacisoli]|uniref:hypothetical protein n=1 Tax=Nocardioides panacisoli TaxID=627624 RepID=UPI001C635141|nr:hypothetical protein [Nocardioides panacisoli]QYJ04102.1 hypothetical protein KUV85_00035 [Nocardioides panacisoli]
MESKPVRRVPTVILCVLAVLGMVSGVLVGLGGAFLVVEDAGSRTDQWDGLGAMIGVLLLGGAALVLCVCALLLWLLVRQPRAGLWTTGVLAGLGLLTTAMYAVTQLAGGPQAVPWGLVAAYAAGSGAVLALVAWGLSVPEGAMQRSRA